MIESKFLNYSVELMADSVTEVGGNIKTFVLTYPRFIHSEFMTHRLFSRNAMSSRAIPVEKMIENIQENYAYPAHWGKNQPGMQAKEEHNESVTIDLNWLVGGLSYTLTKEEAWYESMQLAISVAKGFANAGYHKQIVNRLLEPYQMMRTVLTSTELDNWYWLRNHEDAQPEIKILSSLMLDCHKKSKPKLLDDSEWHVPFYKNGVWSPSDKNNYDEDIDMYGHTLQEALKISSSCCAQSSFRNADESLDKAERVWDRLVESEPVHASPFEHQAKPMTITNIKNEVFDFGEHEGTTHIDKNGDIWSGNFKGWIQHRQLIPNHVCNKYDIIMIDNL